MINDSHSVLRHFVRFSSCASCSGCSFRCKWLAIIKVFKTRTIWLSNLFLRQSKHSTFVNFSSFQASRNLSFRRKFLEDGNVLLVFLRNVFFIRITTWIVWKQNWQNASGEEEEKKSMKLLLRKNFSSSCCAFMPFKDVLLPQKKTKIIDKCLLPLSLILSNWCFSA